ncbi:hypothetical protein [Parachlamydia acanthamoebae]|uniref:hypothetical protein n=1 Tax=Parachlamydia acanthamoebae TaxID=83552 RepID=UPI000751759E|nr:hypothetical protein [Parachlamydia acanthamoebae]
MVNFNPDSIKFSAQLFIPPPSSEKAKAKDKRIQLLFKDKVQAFDQDYQKKLNVEGRVKIYEKKPSFWFITRLFSTRIQTEDGKWVVLNKANLRKELKIDKNEFNKFNHKGVFDLDYIKRHVSIEFNLNDTFKNFDNFKNNIVTHRRFLNTLKEITESLDKKTPSERKIFDLIDPFVKENENLIEEIRKNKNSNPPVFAEKVAILHERVAELKKKLELE